MEINLEVPFECSVHVRVRSGRPAVTMGPSDRWAPADPPEVIVTRVMFKSNRRDSLLTRLRRAQRAWRGVVVLADYDAAINGLVEKQLYELYSEGL